MLPFPNKVSDIDAEYFPPREDVVLQNEAPTDLYILVSGAVVSDFKRLKTFIEIFESYLLTFLLVLVFDSSGFYC